MARVSLQHVIVIFVEFSSGSKMSSQSSRPLSDGLIFVTADANAILMSDLRMQHNNSYEDNIPPPIRSIGIEGH